MKYSDVGSQCKVQIIKTSNVKKKCCNLFILQMIMTKITGAQSPIMTKKYTKFEKDSLKDSREKLRTNPDRQTDRQTDGRTDGQTDGQTGWFQYTPPQLVGGGYKNIYNDFLTKPYSQWDGWMDDTPKGNIILVKTKVRILKALYETSSAKTYL